MSRGDVWLMLPEAPDGARAEPRPCVILSPPEMHDHLGLVTVALVTPAAMPAAYRVPFKLGAEDVVIRLEQIRSIDKHALTRQVGTVGRKPLASALAALREMFAD